MPDHLTTARHYLAAAQETADRMETTREKQQVTPISMVHGIQMAQVYALMSIAESLQKMWLPKEPHP